MVERSADVSDPITISNTAHVGLGRGEDFVKEESTTRLDSSLSLQLRDRHRQSFVAKNVVPFPLPTCLLELHPHC